MPNLNERFFQLWDNTTQLMSNKEAKASFLQQIDTNQDGKVTVAELRSLADVNKDGQLDAIELENLAIKASASDFDKSTIKAMAQSTHLGPQLVLYEVEVLPAPVNPIQVTSESPASADKNTAEATESKEVSSVHVQPALQNWKAGQTLTQLKESFQTAISYQAGSPLPSRNPDALKVVQPGLFRLQEQVGNSCGTTSLSMVLKFWQGHTLENSVTAIDKQIRANGSLELNLPSGKKNIEIDGFTAPRDIVNYARSHGMRAGLKNQSSINDLKSYLDKGVPVMCLTDWHFGGGSYERPAEAKPDGKSLHWIDIIGYEYQNNPQTKKPEMYLIVGNPWGVVQHVSESDFAKVWSSLELEIPGGKRVKTGMDRLFVTMVPRDDEHTVVAPTGITTRAGEISVPTGNDGLKGWLAQKTSDVLQDVSELQKNMGIKSEQLGSEMASGYDQSGVMGAIKNLLAGDQKELSQLQLLALEGDFDKKADIINQIMEKGVNRSGFQQIIYNILSKTPSGREFDRLLEKINTATLANKLGNDTQAGQILARIAQSEINANGQTGSKFEAFATQLAIKHRHLAILSFLSDPQVEKAQFMHKVPASLVRDAIRKLMQGFYSGSAENAIFEMLKSCSSTQFDQITAQLNMAGLASEIHDDAQLGEIAERSVQQGIQTGNWNSFSEILTHLSQPSQYTRADNVLGRALNSAEISPNLMSIPPHLRSRIVDLLNDPTRWRGPEAIKALAALKKIPL